MFDDVELPPGYVLRVGRAEDQRHYVDLSWSTLGRYARELFGLTEQECRRGLGAEYDPSITWFVAFGAAVVGALAVLEHADHLRLDHMVIAPPHQGRGVGSALVRATQRAATDCGLPVLLSVVDGNPARELYERLGFVLDRVEPPRTFLRWSELA